MKSWIWSNLEREEVLSQLVPTPGLIHPVQFFASDANRKTYETNVSCSDHFPIHLDNSIRKNCSTEEYRAFQIALSLIDAVSHTFVAYESNKRYILPHGHMSAFLYRKNHTKELSIKGKEPWKFLFGNGNWISLYGEEYRPQFASYSHDESFSLPPKQEGIAWCYDILVSVRQNVSQLTQNAIMTHQYILKMWDRYLYTEDNHDSYLSPEWFEDLRQNLISILSQSEDKWPHSPWVHWVNFFVSMALSILKQSPLPFIMMDEKGEIVAISSLYSYLLGYKVRTILEKDFSRAFSPSSWGNSYEELVRYRKSHGHFPNGTTLSIERWQDFSFYKNSRHSKPPSFLNAIPYTFASRKGIITEFLTVTSFEE